LKTEQIVILNIISWKAMQLSKATNIKFGGFS